MRKNCWSEYLNNTQLVIDRCEGNIIKFGDTMPPTFQVPQWFIDQVNASRTPDTRVEIPEEENEEKVAQVIDEITAMMKKPKFVMKPIGGK